MILCGMCGFRMTKIRSGVTVCETFGPAPSHEPKPYKLWHADLFVCETSGCVFCGVNIVADFANGPFAKHFQKDFADKLAKNPPDFYWHERRGT